MRLRPGTAADRIDVRWSVAGAQWHRLARMARSVRRSAGAAVRRPEAYGVRTFGDTTIVLRPPRLQDASGWCDTRIAERLWLQDAFGDVSPSPSDWADEHTALAWTERCVRLRRAAAHGRALPGVLVAADEDGRVFGELGIDMIDVTTGTGELSAWRSEHLPTARIMAWAAATLLLHAFTGPDALRRVVAPVAVGNVAPGVTLGTLGFRCELVLEALRPYRGVATDHALYVLHNSSRTRTALRAMIPA